MQKILKRIFFVLTLLALTTPLWVSKELLFPFVTSKAFFLRIVVELALPIYVYLLVVRKDYRPSVKNFLSWSVLAFVLFSFISAIFGVDVPRSLWGNFERMGGAYYIAHLGLLYFYVLLLSKISTNWVKKLLDGAIIIGVLVTVNGLINLLLWQATNHAKGGWLVPDPSLPRVSSTFGNPIFIASFLVITTFFSWFFALREEGGFKKFWYWFATATQFLGIYISGTRGAVVGLIAGGFVAAVIYLIKTDRRKVKVWGAGALIAGIAVVSLLVVYKDKLPKGSMLQRVVKLKDSNSEARLIQWRTALKGFKDAPILGVGPENYYVISNKYFNPEIYKYDASWFDKPHNYTLEILVTGGILGFAAYAGMLIFALWALYKAYKQDILSLGELCVFIFAMVAYQVQNLFVFDTVSASMIFFLFLGFCGFLWEEAYRPVVKTKVTGSVYIQQSFSYAILGLSTLVAFYGVVATNILPAKASKNVNYGYAYSSVDPKIAQEKFLSAINSPFNFDRAETASKYQEFAVSIMQRKDQIKDEKLVQEIYNTSLDALRKVTEKEPQSPISWYKLASVLINKAYFYGQPLDPEAVDAINTSVSLAPRRVEPLGVLLQVKEFQGKFDEALKIVQQMADAKPNDLDVRFQTAIVYKDMGKTDESLKIYEELYEKKYGFSSPNQFGWVIGYYEGKGDWASSVRWYEYATKIKPDDVTLYVSLARAYAMAGNKDQALNLAAAIEKFDPSKKTDMDQIRAAFSPAVLSASTTASSTSPK